MRKNIILGIIAISIALFVTSCAPKFSSKQVSHKEIYFRNLEKPDFTIIDNLSAEVTITFDAKGNPTVSNAGTYNVGYINDLYLEEDDSEFRSYRADSFFDSLKKALLGILSATDANANAANPSYQAVQYALAMKYPDMDYFINIRIETKGAQVIAYAKGIELRTN